MRDDIVVHGLVIPDEKYRQMKKVYDVCVEAGVSFPEEVRKFFDFDEPYSDEPGNDGFHVELQKEEFSADDCKGWDIKVSDIPEKVHTIRVFTY